MEPDSKSLVPSVPDTVGTTSTSLNLSQGHLDEYLERKNIEFMSALAPTLSFIVVLMACGLLGNTLVFVVYYKRFKPSVTRTYILAMSVCDLMTNVLSLPADIVEVRFHNTFEERWLCRSVRTVKSFLGFLSACILVAVALDRHQTICNPSSKPARIRRVYVLLLVSTVLALVITLPYTVLTGRQTVHYSDSNLTGTRCSIDDTYIKSGFLFVYNVVTGLVFLVCMSLMIVSYVRIARQLWLHKKHSTVTGRAVGDRVAGASVHNTHTYVDEETCVDGVQLSTEARTKSDESSDRDPQAQEHTSCPDAAYVLADYDSLCASSSCSTEDNLGHLSSKTGVRRKPFVNENVRSLGISFRSQMDHSSSDLNTEASNPKRSDTSSPRSRAVIANIRRTASDAKAFLTRHKSTPKPRCSVRKIPTRTTFMMFVLTVIFIINYLPYLALVSVRSRRGMGPLIEALGINGYHAGLRSYFINSAVNPLVYSFCSARFRQECRRLFNRGRS